jgi:hypothetical protein
MSKKVVVHSLGCLIIPTFLVLSSSVNAQTIYICAYNTSRTKTLYINQYPTPARAGNPRKLVIGPGDPHGDSMAPAKGV